MESNEDFTLSLKSIGGSRLGSKPVLNFTIADDDNNQTPVVTLGENFQANTGQMVTLTAQATDSDNDTMSYLWEQTAGSTVTLTNADSLSVNFTAPNTAQSLTFKFTATDFRGASSSQVITVTTVFVPTPKESSGGGGTIFWLTILSLLLLTTRKFTIK